MSNSDDKTVYILDSYGLIFRSYFAFISRPLTNSRGENVSAIFGFFRNLHWVLQHYKPNYIFAAMDSKTKTFRHEMYEQYKATRNKTPDDLHAQIPWIEEVLAALGIPVLQCDGYEADDIIATVAKKCEEEGRSCRILSGDKDLMQLVTQNTQILKPETGASTWKITDSSAVKAEWGVEPAQLLDLLSLYGDSADNIPGVAGVGVKTASKLLNDYQNLDGIYAHIEELKGAMKQKLIDGKENAYFSQKLVKLFDAVPCEQINEALKAQPYSFDYSKAAEVLKKYEVFAVAKSYAELGLNQAFTPSKTVKASGKTEEALFPQENEAKLECIQNDTSNYKAITRLTELKEYISNYLEAVKTSPKLPIAYDSETDGLDTMTCRLLGFSLCFKEKEAVYIPIQQSSEDLFSQTDYIELEDALEQLLRIFTCTDAAIIMHNAKFDLKVLINNTERLNVNSSSPLFTLKYQVLKANIIDTMVTAWLQNPERTSKSGYSLEYLGESLLGIKGIEFTDIVKKGQSFSDLPLETAYKYAAEDADFTLKLWNKLNSIMKEKKVYLLEKVVEENNESEQKDKEEAYSLFELEMKLLPLLTKMELDGIHLDSAQLNEYSKELAKSIALIEANIYKEVGHEFNIASPKQLQTVLFEERNLKTGKKTKTGYSTDTTVLEELAETDIVPKMILEYRELAKLQSTYVDTLPKLTDKKGRIHTDFVQTGTATGRLSCREPNLQNIPVRNAEGRKIRSAFTAPRGKVLISADYSQIELVVLAHLSGDKNMSKSFIEGTDIHKATASLIFGVNPQDVSPQMRRTAKTINFGVIYGMSAFRLAKDLGISRTQASSFIDNYFRTYSAINDFINNTIHFAEETGYVTTIFGRRRPILNINSRNKIEKSAAERIAVNTPVQGSAADIVKKAMLDISQALQKSNSRVKLLLQVHDELIFECPDDEQTISTTISLIKDKMENVVKLSVPLKVSIEYGKNWGEFH